MTRNEIIANLRGIICPVATPFNRRGDVDEGRFRDNLTRLAGTGLAGILVAGSTGEAPYLSEKERLRLLDVARGVVKPPQILLAGTGLESTLATLRLSRQAVAHGADAVLVLTPNYFKSRMDAAALVAHYRTVAAGVKQPVLIYSIPQFTGLEVDPETIGKLSRLPNVVGLKESSGKLEFVRAVLANVKKGFRVLVGAPGILYDALDVGAVGGVLGVANFAPELCVDLYYAFISRQPEKARDLQEQLLPLGQKIAAYGVPGIKMALELCGYYGGTPRLPLLPVPGAARRQILAALQQAGARLIRAA
jgi:4-hydroxy-2-oxoglutarate aldolase